MRFFHPVASAALISLGFSPVVVGQEFVEPELPETEWQEVPEASLFPAMPAAELGGGEDFPPVIPNDFYDNYTPENTGAGVLEMKEMMSPGELEAYLESLPELEEVGELPQGEIDQALQNQMGQIQWWENPRTAKKHAEEEGKYFLLAFVGLSWQTLSNSLNEEVFNSPAFARFASEELVVSYLDFESRPDQNHPVYNRFREVCGVKGYPAVALFAPDGVLVETFNGYSKRLGGRAYLRRLTERVAYDKARVKAVEKKRRALEASGFRVWHNAEGKGVFARMRGLKSNRVLFEHDDGRRTMAPLSKLSFVDREVARRLWEKEKAIWSGETPVGR